MTSGKCYYENDNLIFYFGEEDDEYVADVTCTGNWWHDPGCMYTKNGDGWPPDDGLDIDEIKVNKVTKDGIEVPVTKEMEEAIEEVIEEFDWDNWSGYCEDDDDCDYEPWKEAEYGV